MTKPSENLTAREFVWEHRLRQRITLERIISMVGNPAEQARANQFLEAMAKANPGLLEECDEYPLELFEDGGPQTPELFDASEYSKAKGRKTALKLPKDILWEEKVIRRAVREYRDLFHPCDRLFINAMKGLEYLYNLFPELFARAREQAVGQRDQILNFEIFCKCDCASRVERRPADSFKVAGRGRFSKVSQRIGHARQAVQGTGDLKRDDWQFFLDRIGEIAPEMLEQPDGNAANGSQVPASSRDQDSRG